MIRPHRLVVRCLLTMWGLFLLYGVFFSVPGRSLAQPPAAKSEAKPGRFFAITDPINDAVMAEISVNTKELISRTAAHGEEPTLVFVIRAGEVLPGRSAYGACHDLATFLSTKLEGAKRTVAYVPEPLRGYAVLTA